MGVKHGLSHSEELGLRVLGNRALRKIFGPKMEGMTGYWR
jgi:hypothetical protein